MERHMIHIFINFANGGLVNSMVRDITELSSTKIKMDNTLMDI